MLYHWSMDSNCSTPISYLNFLTAYFAKRNLNSGDFEKRAIRNPARIPPQTPPAGGKSAEAGRIHSPRHIVSPCRVRFNRLDFARSNFELRPVDTAKIQNPNSRQKCGRAGGATLGLNSRQTQSPPGFSTLRVAQKVRFDLKF